MVDKKQRNLVKGTMTAEERRLQEDHSRKANWKRWGPYLSERQWGTVREDYSAYGTAWEYFPHDHARSRAYRWGEDGLGGICDRHQFICFALALWNGKDPILKERLFGLTGNEGNHGEDVKEYYYYLDSTPTHSYMKFLYKYPQREFPYARLVEENRRRGKRELEFELIDTGVFDDNRYFDVTIEYAKAGPDDILIRIEATNRGPEPAPLHLLPTVWFRNTWSWGLDERRPKLRRDASAEAAAIKLDHYYYGSRWLYCEGSPALVFTENDTNNQRIFDYENPSPYVKDGINDFVVHGVKTAVNPNDYGTKAAAHYVSTVASGETMIVRLRLSPTAPAKAPRDLTARLILQIAQRARRSGGVLSDGCSRRHHTGSPERHAPSIGRSPVEQAVLPLRSQPLAERRSGGTRATARTAQRSQS